METKNFHFEPIAWLQSFGSEIQRSKTTYKGTAIIHEIYFPWNIFKNPTDIFTVDLILPINTVLKNGTMNPDYYTAEGFGMPEFKTLNAAIKFIDNH